MADETTQNDTQTSTETAAETASPEQSAQSAEAGDGTSAEQSTAETEGSALGSAGLKAKEGEEGSESSDTTEGEGGEGEAKGAPEKYEFALEGVDLDTEALAEAEPILRELNLSNEDANKLLPAANQLVEKTRDGMMQQLGDAVAQQKSDWLDASKKDETIGGAKFEENLGLAAKALDTLGFKEGHPFRQALDETGFGNHRDMIFAFSEMGRMVGEDGTFAREGVGSTETVAVEKRLYPND